MVALAVIWFVECLSTACTKVVDFVTGDLSCSNTVHVEGSLGRHIVSASRLQLANSGREVMLMPLVYII